MRKIIVFYVRHLSALSRFSGAETGRTHLNPRLANLNYYVFNQELNSLSRVSKDEVIVRVIVNKEERKRIVQAINESSGKSPETIAIGGHVRQDKAIGKCMEMYVLLCFTCIMSSCIMH